jgi:hypothetical protein
MNTAVKEEQLLKGSIVKLNDKYSIRVVDNLSDFETLREAWDKLANKQKEYFPFLCFDWFKLWLEHFLKDDELFILLLYKNDEVEMIAPFLIKREKCRGINIKKFELMGNVYSPLRYFVFCEHHNNQKENDVSLIMDFLIIHYRKWDIVDLSTLPEENGYYDVIRNAINAKGMAYSEYHCFGDWYINGIKYTGDEYFDKLPERIRKDVLYCHRRLHTMGEIEFKVISDRIGLDQYIDFYYDVYSRSWQKREGVGPNFHRDLAKIAVRNGWLRMGFLLYNDLPIATQFWLSCNGTAYILKTVYDQNYKKYSPGKILTTEMFKYIIDVDKVKMIDYVQGDEPYKKDWTPQRRERKGIIVYNNNVKGRYLGLLNNKVLPVLRKSQYMRKLKDVVKGVRNEKDERDAETSSA